MTDVVFYFDFGSPNAYLAHKVIPAIEARTGAKFKYVPALLGGIFKATGNRSPAEAYAGIPSKLRYEGKETERFVKKHGITEYARNPHFPVNTLQIMRGAVAAQKLGVFEPYVEAVYRAMWVDGLKMDDPAVIETALSAASLPASELMAGMNDPHVKQSLIVNTETAVAHGVFGSPSFLVGEELFFGKDRLRDVEEEIAAQSTSALARPHSSAHRFPRISNGRNGIMAGATVNPNGTLKDKVAIVTGASRGIGAAIAARLAQEGARVVATARTADEGESRLSGTLTETVEHIKKAGGEARFVKADLSHPEERERLVETTVASYGPVDILVNNGAVTYFIPVVDFPEKRLKLMFEVQVFAPFHLAQLVLPSMKERHTGWIVNISSGAAFHPKPPYAAQAGRGGTVYGMCKAALERFTTGLAAEVNADGVAVNVVSPGLVETPGTILHNLVNDATRSRVQPVEYIAEAVYQLCKGDYRTMTGRIDHAAPFLKEMELEPAALI